MARRWKKGDKITPDVLNECLDIMAKVVSHPGGELYVPMYERIEREINVLEQKKDTLSRIRARHQANQTHSS